MIRNADGTPFLAYPSEERPEGWMQSGAPPSSATVVISPTDAPSRWSRFKSNRYVEAAWFGLRWGTVFSVVGMGIGFLVGW